MALPWHIPLGKVSTFKEKSSCRHSTLIKHYCNLKLHQNPIEELQTGLMCEIGTSNRASATIQRLIACGMTVARLKMRDLEPEACAQLVQSIRQAVYNYSVELKYVYPLALIVDIKGPDITTGNLKAGSNATAEIIQYGTIRLTIDTSWRDCGTCDCLYLGYDHLLDLQQGDIIYIDSLTQGNIKLVVTEIGDDSLECAVAVGGTIGSKMTVRISQIPRDHEYSRNGKGDSVQSTSCSHMLDQVFEHVDQQIAWAVASDVDAVLVPSVQNAVDIRQIKEALSEKGKHILVFASIDTVLGLDNIDEILKEADGIFIDRTVLTMDLPIEKIFVAHKVIFAKCNDLGKPCICKAVINEQMPTMCVTDIANLVLDGVDVISIDLDYDSPLKKISSTFDPIRMAEHCLTAAAVVCKQAERIMFRPRINEVFELVESQPYDPTKAMCLSAVQLAIQSQALAIVCLTNSGRTAKMLSYSKAPCPIVAVTRNCHTGRQIRFWRGVRAVHYFEAIKGIWVNEVDARIQAALDYCKSKDILQAGDAYVVVSGSRRGVGYCDTVRLLYASARETVDIK